MLKLVTLLFLPRRLLPFSNTDQDLGRVQQPALLPHVYGPREGHSGHSILERRAAIHHFVL